MNEQYIDHADIVVTHACNNNCKFCIDKFVNTEDRLVSIEDVEKFMKLLRKNTDRCFSVLLLGGEPTTAPLEHLIDIANVVHKYGFRIMMSTNGINKEKIINLLPHFDWIQITVHSDKQIDFWRQWPDKVNIKWSGDQSFTIDKLHHFVEYTKGFARRSVSMYFTEDWKNLCKDEEVWKLLNTLDWHRNGSYYYSFYEGVRFKKCVPGETNFIDEPTIPKLYPNGNYNKTWNHEELDDYLSENAWSTM
jgi:organic radical activating enzyme